MGSVVRDGDAVKLYLAGPMSNKQHYNADRFALAASILRSYGYAVVTPIEIDRRVDPHV